MFIGLGGKIVPDIACQRIGRQRTAGVGPKECYGYTHIGRQIVSVQEIRRQHNLTHLLLVFIRLGPGPETFEAGKVILG